MNFAARSCFSTVKRHIAKILLPVYYLVLLKAGQLMEFFYPQILLIHQLRQRNMNLYVGEYGSGEYRFSNPMNLYAVPLENDREEHKVKIQFDQEVILDTNVTYYGAGHYYIKDTRENWLKDWVLPTSEIMQNKWLIRNGSHRTLLADGGMYIYWGGAGYEEIGDRHLFFCEEN